MSRPSAITADLLLTGTSVIERPLLYLEEGRIARITTQLAEETPAGALALECQTIAPGFLDIHVHGAGGRDVMEGTSEAVAVTARMLARYGTTSFLATTVTAPVDHTLRALEALADAVESAPVAGAARPVGIHLEGPFLSHAKRGVHPSGQLQPASIALFERFREAARGHIRLMTIAPELPGAIDLVRHAAGLGIRVSLGHSNALATEARAGIAAAREAGAANGNERVSATHTYNAMRGLDHREPGILGVVLDDKALYAELICDGVHTTAEAVRLWFQSKGADHAILVTDGMAATGMPDGQYKLGELDVEVKDGVCTSGGVLAGSVLTMDRAVDNLRRFTGLDIPTAARLATRNPATLLDLPHLGTVALGEEANLTVFGADGAFKGTIVRGQLLAQAN